MAHIKRKKLRLCYVTKCIKNIQCIQYMVVNLVIHKINHVIFLTGDVLKGMPT